MTLLKGKGLGFSLCVHTWKKKGYKNLMDWIDQL
jgi:hypothetical protein